MRLSRAMAISNRTAPRSDASGVAFSEIRQNSLRSFWRIPENGKTKKFLEIIKQSLEIPEKSLEIP